MGIGTTTTFLRPDRLFDRENLANPETASFTVVRPAVLPELSDEEFQATLDEGVAELEKDAKNGL